MELNEGHNPILDQFTCYNCDTHRSFTQVSYICLQLPEVALCSTCYEGAEVVVRSLNNLKSNECEAMRAQITDTVSAWPHVYKIWLEIFKDDTDMIKRFKEINI